MIYNFLISRLLHSTKTCHYATALISHFIDTKHLQNENLKISSYLFICEYHIVLSYYMYVSYHEIQDPLLHLLFMFYSSCILVEIKSLKCLT